MPTINATTGKLISGVEEAYQSLSIALDTDKNTRIMRRDFGAERTTFVDRGINRNNLIDYYAEIAEAMKFEPRLRLVRVNLATDSVPEKGHAIFDIEAVFYPRGHLGDLSEAITLTGPIVWSEEGGYPVRSA